MCFSLTCHVTGFLAKWRQGNKQRNSDLGSASDWLKHISHLWKPVVASQNVSCFLRLHMLECKNNKEEGGGGELIFMMP